MGHSVVCSCGQRNQIDTFTFGEAKHCLACGALLPSETGVYTSEEFVPVVTGFEEPSRQGAVVTGFESPSLVEDEPPAPSPVVRAWEGRVREVVRATEEQAQCARCKRPFRGAWDQHPSEEGALCHICNVQADKEYIPPADWLRRELYRPVAPRKVHQSPPPDAEENARRKKKEVFLLLGMGIATLVIVNVFPVETWMAQIFATDTEAAEGLSVAWHWVAFAVYFAVNCLGQGIGLYAALAWTRLLYDGGLGENWPTLAYLSVVFAILNKLVILAGKYFMFFGPVAGILIGMAVLVSLMIKLLMISERYPLRIESGIGFLLSWTLCSLFVWPCTFVIHRLIQGIVATIAM